MNNQIALHTVNEMQQMATAIAKSGLFGMKTADQALALMLLAQAEGYHPVIAARDFHIINGKPTLKADAILARHQATGGTVQWHEYTDKIVSATFTHPSGGTLKVEWTVEMAQKIGLMAKDVWKQYTRAMLRSRTVSEGVRAVNAGCIAGIYTQEEIENIPPEKEIYGTVIDNNDTPIVTQEEKESMFKAYENTMRECKDMEQLKSIFTQWQSYFKGDKDILSKIVIIKDEVKNHLLSVKNEDKDIHL